MNAWAERRPRTSRQLAEATADEHYGALETEVVDKVCRRLSGRHMDLDRSDVEEAYCLAWHGVYEQIARGVRIASLDGMLVEVTWRRAVETYRQLRRNEHADADIERQVVEDDLDQRLDDQVKLQRLLGRVRGRLSPQERQVISLCWLHGYSRPEARALLGIKDEARMQKLMDRASKKVGGIVAAIEARGCGGEEWSHMLRSYALGMIDEQQSDYRRASEHIEDCASCRRYVLGLRRIAAIVPPFVPGAPHPTQFFAFLHRLFGDASTGAAASSLQTGAATVSGAGAAGGGATLIGTLGSAKVAAVLVVAVAAGATAAIHDGQGHHARHSHHRAARVAASPSSTLGHAAGVPPTLPRSESTSARAARSIHSTSRAATTHASAVQKEFGFEGGREGDGAAAAPTASAASARSSSTRSSASSSQSGASVRAVEREFGPER